MLEVEMKYKLLETSTTQQRLRDLEFQAERKQEEIDTYFNAPDRDFAQTDEALRIRLIGFSAILTYKGPKQGQQGKIRTEIEIPFDGRRAEELRQFFIHLGYRLVRQVSKARTFFRRKNQPELELTLDEVVGLGTYLEMEIKADDKEGPQALTRLKALATELDLGKEERRSYLEILMEKDRNQTS